MNLFLGTFDGVLEAMVNAMPVERVAVQRGKMRNLRLQHRLLQQGVEWVELATRADFDELSASEQTYKLCVVAGLSFILPQHFIDRCDLVVNFHPGIVQQCRGPQPVAAAILNGHREYGVTVHRIDTEQIDAGPIIEQRKLAIDYQKSYGANYQQLKAQMAELARDVFTRFGPGSWPTGESWLASDSAYYGRLDSAQILRLAQAATVSNWRR